MNRFFITVVAALSLLLASTAISQAKSVQWQEMKVAATAYNSVAWQTTASNPSLAAWGDTLKPGMRAIAVSRDLIKKGLTHGTKVKIEGLPGVYVVRDKMGARWRNKIDIYMGKDVAAARQWGIQDDIKIQFANASNG